MTLKPKSLPQNHLCPKRAEYVERTHYVCRMVNLEGRDYRIVRMVARERGLGAKGFSAALRMIIREWEAAQYSAGQKVNISLEPPEDDSAADAEETTEPEDLTPIFCAKYGGVHSRSLNFNNR